MEISVDGVSLVDVLGGPRILSMRRIGYLPFHEMVVRGMPVASLEAVLGLLRVGDDALATVLGSSPATIRRRRREGGVLTSRESDGLYRLASTLARAVDALGSQEAAREWLLEPQRGLGGREPIGLLSTTPGQNAVFQLLGRIEHGVYT